MCGIAGIFTSGEPLFINRIKLMTDVLKHRGPDGEGQWISDNNRVGLGHRRLSIIDLSDVAKQPMHYLDRYTITFNGEIYNYIELRESLLQKGYQFKSKSDTEVLLALYDLKKEKCLHDLDGMFSFSIWDEKKQTLFCARDRFGEKPFFYHHQPGKHFIFASEMKALFSSGIEKKVNNSMLYNYLTNGWVENPHNKSETFYYGIQKLPAGHYIIIENDLVITPKKYWQINLETKTDISFNDASIQFKNLLNQSVRNRLRSDVSVGSSLSGGIDSSTIVQILNSLETSSLKTFSASFPGYEKDETSYMRLVAENTKAECYFTTPGADVLTNEIDKIFYHQEEPFASSSIVAQWEVMKLAGQQSTIVLLDGQGADEILAGYTYYYRSFFQELYSLDKSAFEKEYSAYKSWGGGHFRFNWEFKLQALFPNLYNTYLSFRSSPLPHADIHRDFYNLHKASTFKPLTFKPSLNYHMHNTLCVNGMFEALLRYSDRNSMAFSREVRLPFLDHKLVEFVYSLPAEYKIHNGWTKYLLRKAYEGFIPEKITWRKDKTGYAPPENQWMKSPDVSNMLDKEINFLCKEQILDKKHIDQNKMWMYLMTSKLVKNG